MVRKWLFLQVKILPIIKLKYINKYRFVLISLNKEKLYDFIYLILNSSLQFKYKGNGILLKS
jgi:hypothetical protein